MTAPTTAKNGDERCNRERPGFRPKSIAVKSPSVFPARSNPRCNSSRYCDRKARARSCVSATNRCISGESAVARAIADRSDSSSSSSAYAVSFGSSTFILLIWLWVKWDEISGDLSVTLSQRLQCSVKQHSHIIGGCLHDLRDLLVTEIVLEFKLNHFLLPRRQGADNPQQEPGRFLCSSWSKGMGCSLSRASITSSSTYIMRLSFGTR